MILRSILALAVGLLLQPVICAPAAHAQTPNCVTQYKTADGHIQVHNGCEQDIWYEVCVHYPGGGSMHYDSPYGIASGTDDTFTPDSFSSGYTYDFHWAFSASDLNASCG